MKRRWMISGLVGLIVATIIAFLQPATMYKAPTEGATQGLLELEWFANTLIDFLGVDEYNRLLDELGL